MPVPDVPEDDVKALIADVSALQAEWRVADQDLAAALGLPVAKWTAMRDGGLTSCDRDSRARAQALVEIGTRLKIVFSESIAADWVTLENAEFEGRSPIDVCADAAGLATVLMAVQGFCEGN